MAVKIKMEFTCEDEAIAMELRLNRSVDILIHKDVVGPTSNSTLSRYNIQISRADIEMMKLPRQSGHYTGSATSFMTDSKTQKILRKMLNEEMGISIEKDKPIDPRLKELFDSLPKKKKPSGEK